MITERTLRKWRGEAIGAIDELREWDSDAERTKELRTSHERILRMTQELLDQHLLRKVVR